MQATEFNNWQELSVKRQKQYRQALERCDKNKTLRQLPNWDKKAFSKINCLQCANCCKHYSPRFTTTDIKRIRKTLKMGERIFIETYLKLDEDGDFVAKAAPCPFLGLDNYCSIYESRPTDCRRYPYTSEDVLLKRVSLTLKNTTVCPAAFYVVEKIVQYNGF